MACNTLNNITKSCDNNQGGIYVAYVNDTDNITTFTTNGASHSVTGLTSSTDFVTFDFVRNVGSVVADPKIDLINGSTYFEVTVTFVFHRREAAKSRALTVLGEGQRYLDIIVKDANGLYSYIDHAQLSGGTEETGTAKADGSKYNVTFIAQMDNRPYFVSDALVATVI